MSAAPPVYLGRLSDEELVLLDAQHPLVQLPHHDSLDDAAQAVYVRAAERGLRARGHERSADGRTIDMPQHLCDVLDVRSGADDVIALQVMHQDEVGTSILAEHYVFVVDDVALVEDVDAHGLHDYWAFDADDVAAAVQDRVPPVAAADGSGSRLIVDLAAVAAGEDDVTVRHVGRPLAQVDAVRWRPGGPDSPELVAVVLGERGTVAGRGAAGAAGPVQLQPIPVDAVGRTVVALLSGEQ